MSQLQIVKFKGTNKKPCCTEGREYSQLLDVPLDCNGGVLTGKYNTKKMGLLYEKQLTILDIDIDNGTDLDLMDLIDVMPLDTYIVRTGKGGLHYYFYVDSKDIITNTQNKFEKTPKKATEYSNQLGLSGVDRRGKGGFIFAEGTDFTTDKTKGVNHRQSYHMVSENRDIKTITYEEFYAMYYAFIVKPKPKEVKTEKKASRVKPIEKSVVREGFQKMLDGEIVIPHGNLHDVLEHVVWGSLFREVVNCGLMSFDELSIYLATNPEYQPNFDYKKTKTQETHFVQQTTRPTNKLYYRIFPEYKPNNLTFEERIDMMKGGWDLKEKYPPKTRRLDEFLRLVRAEFKERDYRYIDDDKLKCWIEYKNGVYVKNMKIKPIFSEMFIKLDVIDMNPTAALRYAWCGDLEGYCFAEYGDFDTDLNFINYKNGLLNLTTWELEEHRPTHLSFTQIPHNYNKDAVCPNFESLVDTATCEAADRDLMKRQLLEYMGYCMTSESARFGKACIITSKSGTTLKTPILNITKALVGVKNFSETSLRRISQSRFGLATIKGKILNGCDELSKLALKDDNTLKNIITGRYLSFEPKNGIDVMIPNITKFLFICNQLPYVYDMKLPFAKRWIILEFDHKIYNKAGFLTFIRSSNTDFKAGDWIDGKGLFNPLTGKHEMVISNWEYDNIINIESEMEGVIALLIRNLKNLYERDEFEGMDKITVFNLWQSKTNYISQFMESTFTKCDISEMERLDCFIKPEMYKMYLGHCKLNDIKPQDDRIFYKKMSDLGYLVGRPKIMGNKRVYVGIKLLIESEAYVLHISDRADNYISKIGTLKFN